MTKYSSEDREKIRSKLKEIWEAKITGSGTTQVCKQFLMEGLEELYSMTDGELGVCGSLYIASNFEETFLKQG